MIECHVRISAGRSFLKRRDILRAATVVLSGEKKKTADVAVQCVGIVRMRGLNKRYRGIQRPTDVLTFSANEGLRGLTNDSMYIGDIVLCLPYIEQQARTFDVLPREESFRSLVHGLLHAVGHDHARPREAARMFKRQEAYVRRLASNVP